MYPDGQGPQNLPVIDITTRTPLNPTPYTTTDGGFDISQEAELEQSLWTWKPRCFRTSMAPLLISVIYIIMPIICILVVPDKNAEGFWYLVLFSAAPLPLMAIQGIIGITYACRRPSVSGCHKPIIVILFVLIGGIALTGLVHFDFIYSDLTTFRIFPIIVGIFSTLMSGLCMGIFLHYSGIVQKVVTFKKLDAFIAAFERTGKKEDCTFYCSKRGSMF